MIPTYVIDGLLEVFAVGCVRMDNLEAVAWRLRQLDHLAASAWIELHRDRYAEALAAMDKRIAEGVEG